MALLLPVGVPLYYGRVGTRLAYHADIYGSSAKRWVIKEGYNRPNVDLLNYCYGHSMCYVVHG